MVNKLPGHHNSSNFEADRDRTTTKLASVKDPDGVETSRLGLRKIGIQA